MSHKPQVIKGTPTAPTECGDGRHAFDCPEYVPSAVRPGKPGDQNDFLRRAATIPEQTKETPSQEADRIYAEQHPVSKATKTAETCAKCGFSFIGPAKPCGLGGVCLSVSQPEAASEVLTRGQYTVYVDTHATGLVADKLIAHDAALRAALKKAEEVIKTLTIADDRHFDEMSKRGHRAAAAEAKLKKAEEERDFVRAFIRAATDDITLAAEQRDAAEAEVERVTKLHNECHDAIEEGQAREAELRKIIENAPHGCNCKSNLMKYWDEENNCQHPCDCWKAAALRSLRGEK
jgi:hypothetical protein